MQVQISSIYNKVIKDSQGRTGFFQGFQDRDASEINDRDSINKWKPAQYTELHIS